jgi:hypothetical protein
MVIPSMASLPKFQPLGITIDGNQTSVGQTKNNPTKDISPYGQILLNIYSTNHGLYSQSTLQRTIGYTIQKCRETSGKHISAKLKIVCTNKNSIRHYIPNIIIYTTIAPPALSSAAQINLN